MLRLFPHFRMLVTGLLMALAATAYAESSDRVFAPSYLSIMGSRGVALHPDDIEISDWTDPKVCGQCHSRQFEGWNGSMHSNSFRDPVFQAQWAMAVKADPNNETHCGSCHSPIGAATDTITFDPDKGLHGGFEAPELAANGVSCDVCHTITESNFDATATLEHGNASFEMTPGKIKRATLKNSKSPYHGTEYSDLHSKSEFCGNCHNIFHPGNNFPIERTYDEWKYSIYAQNDIQCQDCHMVPVDVAIRVADELKKPQDLEDHGLEGFAGAGGGMRPMIHKHGFVGGNAVVTEVMNKALAEEGGATNIGRETNTEEAIKRLQNAASLKHYLEPQGGPLYKLKVKVTNERAGHHLPTSLTEVRQVWVEVVVKDDQGNEIFRSGSLDENNDLPKNTVIFNAHAVDKNGDDTMLPWEITRFVDVTTIPPKGYKYGKYYFNVPEGAKSIHVVSKLNYRSFSQKMANLLLGDGTVTVPTVEMNLLDQVIPLDSLKAVTSDDEADQSAGIIGSVEPLAAHQLTGAAQ